MTLSTNLEHSQYLNATDTYIMFGQSPSDDSHDNSAQQRRVISSRFGKVEVDPAKAIHFARGLLGIPDRYRYALANFPSEKMRQFMLLQSLEEDVLSFITLPLPLENAIIDAGDLRTACKELQIKEGNLAILVIVSVHRSPGDVKLSVNARAPLFIDAERQLGVQYVFHSDRYQIQHML
ncbi:MAG: flagellar assembly protein FliW [Alphaproteobacteria bacterium]